MIYNRTIRETSAEKERYRIHCIIAGDERKIKRENEDKENREPMMIVNFATKIIHQ